jgi:cell division septal protein FtsQ
MKLKPQPKPARTTRAKVRRGAVKRGARPRGGQARRPGVPLRRRLSGRLPSLRRVLAGLGAVAAAAVLVALLNGPWLRVSRVAWAGEHYTDAADLSAVLESERGMSLLAVDTRALRERLERIPSVAEADVNATLTGSVEAHVVERAAAFVWETKSARFIGADDGTVFAGSALDAEPDPSLASLPHISDGRFAARLITIGDVIPEALLHTAMRVAAIDPAAFGSAASGFAIAIDDEYGFQLVSAQPEWQMALGIYGLDPRETTAEADARLERQITAVRTLFATEAEADIGWVDVRNPGKVYFRAKG